MLVLYFFVTSKQWVDSPKSVLPVGDTLDTTIGYGRTLVTMLSAEYSRRLVPFALT